MLKLPAWPCHQVPLFFFFFLIERSGDDAGEKTFITDLQPTLNTRKEITVHPQLIFTTANWPQVKKTPHFHVNFSSATIFFFSSNLSLKVTNLPLPPDSNAG